LKADPTERFYAEVWPHAQAVLRLAHMLCRDSAGAEDLAQESMLKAFRFIDRFESGSDVRKWLYAIVRNCWTDRLRADERTRGKEVRSDLEWEPEAPADGDDWIAGESRSPREILEGFSDGEMIEALRSLPEEIRWTLLLVDVQQLDQTEAAEILEIPVGTVKSRAHRGRNMLRELLRPRAAGRAHDT
jgi:RNA polymerase sigma-70 factor, ECF subfamily